MLRFASTRAVIFLASSLVFGALVVFGNSITPRIAPRPPEKTIALEVPRAIDPIGDPIMATATPVDISAPRPNLTDTIASMIGRSIALKNPEGRKDGVLTVEETEEIANEALTASLDTSILSRLTPADDEITVLVDPSANELSYRAAADDALGEAAAAFTPDPNLPIARQMTAFSEFYGTMARKLAAIPVPARLQNLHRDAIRSATIKQRAFAAVAEYDTDPVYALLAIKTIKETK